LRGGDTHFGPLGEAPKVIISTIFIL
jgi:hypothetical protein